MLVPKRGSEKCRESVHSTHNDIQNGGEGFATIGSAMAHQLARVPQQQRPRTYAERVREAQAQPLGQPPLLPQLQRDLQLPRVRVHRSRLSHVSVHCAHLRDHLQRDTIKFYTSSLKKGKKIMSITFLKSAPHTLGPSAIQERITVSKIQRSSNLSFPFLNAFLHLC